MGWVAGAGISQVSCCMIDLITPRSVKLSRSPVGAMKVQQSARHTLRCDSCMDSRLPRSVLARCSAAAASAVASPAAALALAASDSASAALASASCSA